MEPNALARLVGSVPEFAEHVWGQRAQLWPGASGADGWPDLLTLGDVDELLSVRGLRTPFLRMAKSGQTLDERWFTTGGGVGAGIADQVADDEVFRQFADGSTIVLQALHRNWPPVIGFAQALAGDLGHPVQVNAYVTPPQSQGFAAHYDVHDVFILQVAGTKEWTVHEPVHRWPTRDQTWDRYAAQVAERAGTEPALSAILKPGDCLYLPRGYVHSAVAQGVVAAHLTVGVHTWTGLDLTRSLLDAALADLTAGEEVRAPLPLGIAVDNPEGLHEAFAPARERLIEVLRAIDQAEVARRLAARVRATQRAEPVRPVASAEFARRLDANGGLRYRRHLALRTSVTDGGSAVLRGRGVDVTVPAVDAAFLRAIPSERPFTPAELAGTCDGALDAAVDLCRRLMLAGVLVPAVDFDGPARGAFQPHEGPTSD